MSINDNKPFIPTDLITPKEAAELLCTHGTTVHTNTIRRWCHDGCLPAFKMGKNRLRVSRADVLAMVKRVETTGPTIPTKAEVNAREKEVDRILRAARIRK